ncbi:hypothetical protein Tco_0150178, partial [Tanacetum coccineum]
CSFICVSGENNETLSLGRKNGLRFRIMIMEEMEEVLGNDGEDFDYETDLNTAEDLRLPEEDNDCMKIKMCEEIFLEIAGINHCNLDILPPIRFGLRKHFHNSSNDVTRQKKLKETFQEVTKGILNCVDAEERVVVNDKYPEQTIVNGKQLPTSFKKKLQDILMSNVDVFA